MFFTSPFTQPLPHAFLHPLIYFWICALQGLPEGQKVEQISVKKPTLNTFHKPQQKAKERNILQGQLNFIFASASWMALAERCKITAAKEIIHSPTWTPHRASAATNCCSSTCWPNPSTDVCSFGKGFGDTSYPDRTTMSCKVMQGPRLLLRINHLSARNSCLWPCGNYSLSVCFINQTLKYNKNTRQISCKGMKINVSTS